MAKKQNLECNKLQNELNNIEKKRKSILNNQQDYNNLKNEYYT